MNTNGPRPRIRRNPRPTFTQSPTQRPTYRWPMQANRTKQELAANNSVYLSRKRLARGLGQQFDGERDLYDALGYVIEPVIDDFVGPYYRDIIARRLVNKPVQSTWQKPPIIKDGEDSTEDEGPTSPFIKILKEIIKHRRLWHFLERADKLAGVGCFGVLLVGVRDGKKLEEPLDGQMMINEKLAGNKLAEGPESLLYLKPRSEQWAQIANFEKDEQSERLGMPLFYNITIGTQTGSGTRKVHWSRVIHIAENKTDDEVYGTPRLLAALNRLYDLDKVVGGSSEAFWLLVRKGLAILADDEADFTEGSAELQAFQDEVDKYTHNITRIMQLAGVKDIKDLGSETPDPTGMFDTLIALLAADADMPQSILVGTQKGGLGGDASAESDLKMWASTIEARQNNFAEPEILRPVIDLLIRVGILPKPSAGEYTVKWEPNYTPTKKEEGEVAKVFAEAIKIYLQALGLGADIYFPPEIFFERFMEYVPPKVDFDLVREEVPQLPPMTEVVANLVANHKGRLVDLACPFCGKPQVMVFEGHGGVALCDGCESAFSPEFHYGVKVNGHQA